jgi:hypothetical protein
VRVLLSPLSEPGSDAVVAAVAQALAGPDGESVPLRGLSEASFRRSLSEGEIYLLRRALLGLDPDLLGGKDEVRPPVVGYVCAGKAVLPSGEGTVIAVADHVNLTWRSPLTGQNDDRLGRRFPVIAGMYEPGLVLSRVGPGVTLPVELGVVAGVRDDRCLLEFESRMVHEQDLAAFSSELVAVALLAAHLGIRLAAAVVVMEEK